MEELIKKENIKVKVKVNDWEDAVKKVGELLLNDGSIDKQYIDNMINSVKTLGPYIVLTQGFALAHAAANVEIVHKPSISVITLENPVSFGSPNDPVKVVMCLACIDQSTHIDTLSKIANKLMKENFLEDVYNSDTIEKLYNVINN